jgi:hypothetical protein
LRVCESASMSVHFSSAIAASVAAAAASAPPARLGSTTA